MKSIGVAALALAALSALPAASQTRGSYLGSCENVRQRGPILQAECEDRRGDLRSTRLDLRDCGRGDIANRNGRLICNGGRGERERGDFEERGPRWDDGRRGPPGFYGVPRF